MSKRLLLLRVDHLLRLVVPVPEITAQTAGMGRPAASQQEEIQTTSDRIFLHPSDAIASPTIAATEVGAIVPIVTTNGGETDKATGNTCEIGIIATVTENVTRTETEIATAEMTRTEKRKIVALHLVLRLPPLTTVGLRAVRTHPDIVMGCLGTMLRAANDGVQRTTMCVLISFSLVSCERFYRLTDHPSEALGRNLIGMTETGNRLTRRGQVVVGNLTDGEEESVEGRILTMGDRNRYACNLCQALRNSSLDRMATNDPIMKPRPNLRLAFLHRLGPGVTGRHP